MASTQSLPNMGHRVNVDFEAGTVTATRKLRQSGGSTVLTIPPEVMDAMELEEGDDLVMQADYKDGEIRLRKSEDE